MGANWMKNIDACASETVVRVLIGNKCDLEDRKVTKERGEAVAEEYGIKFFEASAKENINVSDAFESITRTIMDNKAKNPSTKPAPGQLGNTSGVNVGDVPGTSKKNDCSC